jgi:hypothetical protein
MSHNTPFFFFRTFWASMHHADWDAAAARGPLALIAEFFRAAMGLSAWPFFIPIDATRSPSGMNVVSEWRPSTIRSFLSEYGIESWGWGQHDGEFFFQVKLRQASWAQYLLLQRGVPLSGQLLDEDKRSAYRPGPRRSLRPVAGATYTLRNSPTLTATAKPAATTKLLRDPVGEINRVVDHLAKW